MGKKYVFFFVFFFSFVWPSWKEEEEEDREQTLKDEFVHQSLPYNFFFFVEEKGRWLESLLLVRTTQT
jgi:hypothetical protein